MRILVLALVALQAPAVPAPSSAAAVSPAQSDLSAVQAEAVSALRSDVPPFTARVSLVDRLRDARARSTGEARDRFALLWLRGLRWLLSAIPMGAEGEEPYRGWLASHASLAVYSEPAGQWLIEPDAIWRLHDEHRSGASAEEIAWLAVENGMPGECEGYVPCGAYMLDRLYGEYLRRHPRGAHAAEAALGIRESVAQSLRLLSEPDGSDFLDRPRDCPELTTRLDALHTALVASDADGRADAVATLARLRAVCP
jgi:hypothetical protein